MCLGIDLLGSSAQPAQGQFIGGNGTLPSEGPMGLLHLNPQERHLYQHHLDNLRGGGAVHNPDGSTSTLFQLGTSHNGQDYNLPSVWDGKILDENPAITKSVGDGRGWDYWPSYPHDNSLPDTQEGWAKQPSEVRYGQMHDVMEKDIPEPSIIQQLLRALQGGGK